MQGLQPSVTDVTVKSQKSCETIPDASCVNVGDYIEVTELTNGLKPGNRYQVLEVQGDCVVVEPLGQHNKKSLGKSLGRKLVHAMYFKKAEVPSFDASFVF